MSNLERFSDTELPRIDSKIRDESSMPKEECKSSELVLKFDPNLKVVLLMP
jgi:hypothetical protein